MPIKSAVPQGSIRRHSSGSIPKVAYRCLDASTKDRNMSNQTRPDRYRTLKVSGRLFSLLPDLLPRLKPYARGPILRRIYWALFELWESDGPPAKTALYGFSLLVNRGNLLPFFIHEQVLFNAPLVQLVHQVAAVKMRPITVVDIGAAIGDTVLLLKRECPGSVERFICVEGDEEFHELLSVNMQPFPEVTLVHTMLARETMLIRSLIKHHKGTATCTGSEFVKAIPFDELTEVNCADIDVVKIDVDGFDGEVLAGAVSTLNRCEPAVIFEWDPKRILETANEPFRAFDVLGDCGYTRYAWFNNIGTFSHFSGPCSHEILQKTMDYLLAVNSETHEHFDIVALPAGSELNEIELASLKFVRAAKS